MGNAAEPDYEKLRTILERQLGKKVSLEYAIEAGTFLVNVYDTLLYGDEEPNDTLDVDTTNNRRSSCS